MTKDRPFGHHRPNKFSPPRCAAGGDDGGGGGMPASPARPLHVSGAVPDGGGLYRTSSHQRSTTTTGTTGRGWLAGAAPQLIPRSRRVFVA